MKLSDSFAPRWQNSNQKVRLQAVERIKDIKLLQQIAGKDEDPIVCEAARFRLKCLKVKITIVE